MRLSTKQVSGITPCMNNRQEYAYEYLFMCKGKTNFFFLLLFANTETLEETSEANNKNNKKTRDIWV